MNTIIIFCASYLIYISALFAVLRVFWKHGKNHYVRNLIVIFGSAVFAWVIAHFLKGIIALGRPDSAYPLVKPDDVYSFPSGHATFMFALAFAMYGFDKRAGKIIAVLAIATGIARVLAGVHFWYDIVGGCLLGCVVAYICILIAKRFFKNKK